MSKKLIIVLAGVFTLFFIFAYYQLTQHTLIPDHVHSVDDKPADQRTDDDNILILERTLQKEPKNVNAMIQISDLYIKKGENRTAKKYLEKALEIDPYNNEAKSRLEKIK
jgi:cytochrome c-type biogenesis protein CcmH/NrfG